jgi:hypothetical protein
MCMGGKTPKYNPPPAPPEPPKAPRMVDPSVSKARSDEINQLRKASGRTGTVLTNPSLVSTGSTGSTGKTLLGQ